MSGSRAECVYLPNILNKLVLNAPEFHHLDCYILGQMHTYDQFFIPYQPTLVLIPEEPDDTMEDSQTPLQGLCVKTVRVVRALLDKVLEQFPEVGPALATAFTAYDNGTLEFDLHTGRLLTTT